MKPNKVIEKGSSVQVRLKFEDPWIAGVVTSVDNKNEAIFVQTEDGEYQMDFDDYPELLVIN